MAITLEEIKSQVRNRADMKESSFVEESELVFYINQSITELYDLISDAYGSDYYLETHTFNTASGDESYDLPEDFYELRGVDIQFMNSQWTTIQRFNFNERNRYKTPNSWSFNNVPNIRYRLMGSQIRFNPAPDGINTIKLWYIPKAPVLEADDDEYDDVNGWVEYVIVDAAIKCLQKEESDVTVLAAQKAALIARIQSKAENRDAGSPESVYDVHAENDDYPWGSR